MLIAAMSVRFHNQELQALAGERYTAAQLDRIRHGLDEHETLELKPLRTGLYPASGADAIDHSGYQNVWARDNVYVAYAQWESGHADAAAAVATALLAFYSKYRHRFAVIDPADAVRRPHVRFDGLALEEIPGEQWPHAQNDALGYCLWLWATLASNGALRLDADQLATMALLSGYFAAIRFWQDEDSGHWEETRKISASSIGVVIAGLKAWRSFLATTPLDNAAGASRAELIAAANASIDIGTRTLEAILPAECTQPSPRQHRRSDAALLFLAQPLNVVDAAMAERIVADIREHLQGEVGIRRYVGDSYWAPDYDTRVPAHDRTRDYSNDIETRDTLLDRPGAEAQWCIFDPLVSVFYGRRFMAAGDPADRAMQHRYFTRALAQVTQRWQCPELYYWRDGVLTPNSHTPLLWTQANLMLASSVMRKAMDGESASGGDRDGR
jgi:phosphorylase kinase alpha/beta subunit